MLFEFGRYLVDIDVEATRNYYRNKMTKNDCNCSGCVNFRKFADECDNCIKQAFSDIGIGNMKYIYEIIPYEERAEDYEKEGGNLYGGFFPVIGKIVSEETLNSENSTRHITDYFEIFLADSVSLKPDDFPMPTLQIEILAHIPWLLNFDNQYLY